ncbi:AMP-binding protein, partial [Xanthomonas hortorum]
MTAHVHPVPDWADSASMDAEGYARAYDAAKRDPDGYWREQAQRLDWIVPFTTVKDTSFDEADFRIHWFADGQLNVAANCIDRHLATRADQVAILWEGDAPGTDRRITYRELHEQVSRLANALKGLGVAKGDQVTIYLPMIPEAAFAMLACARIGAIHSIVFGGFSPESLANRIIDCDSRIVITADG